MTEEQSETAHELKETLMKELEDLVNEMMAFSRLHPGFTAEMEELIRMELTEQIRFWK